MARVGRLAGALVAETRGEYFLIGDTKMPCDWRASGFEPPATRDPVKEPFVRLVRCSEKMTLGAPQLALDLEGEELARALSHRFVITRNGSVSERLWNLVIHRGDADATGAPDDVVDARWLGEIPAPLWQVVRDTVLRCI